MTIRKKKYVKTEKQPETSIGKIIFLCFDKAHEENRVNCKNGGN